MSNAPYTSYDDIAREAIEHDPEGLETSRRPYTEAENAAADKRASDASVAAARADFERALALNAEAELAALQAAILAAEGIESGDPWRQPTGAHDAYPLDAIVSHAGKVWSSTVAANVWEPGVSGWLEAGPGVPDWVQPTGAHDAYPLGAHVKHIGDVWESLVDGNVWEPPTQWAQVDARLVLGYRRE